MHVSSGFELRSPGPPNPQVITGQVERLIRQTGYKSAQTTVFLPGSGAGLFTVDCPGGDLKQADLLVQSWLKLSTEPNLLSAMMGNHLILPVVRAQMVRSTWQEFFLIDFSEQPRWHQVTVLIQELTT